jgi:sugar phosphate isomerase/epimerase
VIPPPANAVHPGIGRCEVFDVAPEALPALAAYLAAAPQPFSIHAPLVRPRPGRAPSAVFFLADSPAREESFAELALTLAAAAAHGAQYVVTHLNWVADVPSEGRAEFLAHEAAGRIALLSRLHRVPVHIECGGYTGGFHRAGQFAALARAFPDLGLCLDVGHLWLIAQERGRSAYADIEVLAPYARSMHLWAARNLETYRRQGHLPLHPARDGRDGWLDLGRAVAPVLAARPDCAVILEYTWTPDDAAPAAEGLRWASDVVEGARAAGRA